jgi:hypothetical protein
MELPESADPFKIGGLTVGIAFLERCIQNEIIKDIRDPCPFLAFWHAGDGCKEIPVSGKIQPLLDRLTEFCPKLGRIILPHMDSFKMRFDVLI